MTSPSGYDWTIDKIRVSRLLRELGNAHFRGGRFDKAIDDYNKSLSVLPTVNSVENKHKSIVEEAFVFALINRAFCYHKTSRNHQCALDCSRVLRVDPSCVKALFRRAKAMFELGKYDRSLKDLLKLQEMHKGGKPQKKMTSKVKGKILERTMASLSVPTTVSSTLSLKAISNSALFLVAEYLKPVELGECMLTCKFMKDVCSSNYIWQNLYDVKFGRLCSAKEVVIDNAGYAINEGNTVRWQLLYKNYLFGLQPLNIQVINRETSRNLEFTMSVYDAKATYRIELDKWHVRYLNDDRGVVCETVDWVQLRPLPKELKDPELYSPFKLYQSPVIPHSSKKKVHFQVGDGVEIQWKRQPAHPFGWWYGIVSKIWYGDTKETTGEVGDIVQIQLPGRKDLTSVVIPENEIQQIEQHDDDGGNAKCLTKITVVFDQYKKGSPWYQVTVVLNATEAVRCLGGYLGGIRISNTSRKQWKSFLPLEKIG
jgi:tetratricopeptide (TPR) repeat protein